MHTFFHLLSEGFVNIQTWINNISNSKLNNGCVINLAKEHENEEDEEFKEDTFEINDTKNQNLVNI